jgi:hypothetical protein
MIDYIISAVCDGIKRLVLVTLVIGLSIGLIIGGVIYLITK